MGPSRVANFHSNSLKWTDKIKRVLDFMPVLVIYKFDEDSMKNEVPIVQTITSPLYGYGRLKGK